MKRYCDSISYPTILTWTPTPPLRTSKGQDLFPSLTAETKSTSPIEKDLCCKLKLIVRFSGAIVFGLFFFVFVFVLSWSNFKRKYYNKNVNRKVTLSVIVKQTHLFTSSFAFKSVIPICGIHEKQVEDFVYLELFLNISHL